MESFEVRTRKRTEFIAVTREVEAVVAKSGVKDGLCMVFVPHTTAGVTINENADPTVQADILMELNKIVPFQDAYAHAEGNSAAHAKATLVGASVQIPVADGQLALGMWQGVFFCEFDGPRSRKAYVTVQ